MNPVTSETDSIYLLLCIVVALHLLIQFAVPLQCNTVVVQIYNENFLLTTLVQLLNCLITGKLGILEKEIQDGWKSKNTCIENLYFDTLIFGPIFFCHVEN